MIVKGSRLMAAVLMLSTVSAALSAAQVSPPRAGFASAGVNTRGDDDYEGDFMRRVYEGQVRRALAAGRTPFGGLREDQLKVVEARHRLREDAAEQCKLLLDEAEADLKRQKASGNAEALSVSDIGVYSAYRSVEQDEAAWRNAFRKHSKETKVIRAGLRGGEYGDEAVALMVTTMRRYKAAPGFSRHTSGTAVDFMTTDNGLRLTANSNQNELWRRSWFHKWLVKNAWRFKFHPLATEAWHWEYRG